MAHKILNVFQKHDLRHGTVNDFRYVKKYGSLRNIAESLFQTDSAECLTWKTGKQNIVFRPLRQLLERFVRYIVSGIISE